jgi:N6-L-threonylcarbamoyladenine synthase
MLGLGYPGGRVIDELACEGDPSAYPFPRARVRADAMALSFSGLKTALWEFLRPGRAPARVVDVCASFQEAVVDVLVDRVLRAIETTGITRLALAGGVSANSRLRLRMREAIDGCGGTLVLASLRLCTDNAAMIAAAADMRLTHGLPSEDLFAVSRLPLGRRT